MLVKDIMSTPPNALTEEASLQEAAEEMKKQDFGFLPVRHNGEISGVLTDRDMIVRAFSKGLNPNETKLKDVMTKEVVWCRDSDDVEKVAEIMCEKQLNRLAVYDKAKNLVGVISSGDIARKCNDINLCGKLSEEIHK